MDPTLEKLNVLQYIKSESMTMPENKSKPFCTYKRVCRSLLAALTPMSTIDALKEVSDNTLGQHNNFRWHTVRLHRITASMSQRYLLLGLQCRKMKGSIKRDKLKAFEVHYCSQEPDLSHIPAVRHGTVHENLTKILYNCFLCPGMCIEHRFGFLLHPHNFVWGASLDYAYGPKCVSSCPRHNLFPHLEAIVEIKCPYRLHFETTETEGDHYARFSSLLLHVDNTNKTPNIDQKLAKSISDLLLFKCGSFKQKNKRLVCTNRNDLFIKCPVSARPCISNNQSLHLSTMSYDDMETYVTKTLPRLWSKSTDFPRHSDHFWNSVVQQHICGTRNENVIAVVFKSRTICKDERNDSGADTPGHNECIDVSVLCTLNSNRYPTLNLRVNPWHLYSSQMHSQKAIVDACTQLCADEICTCDSSRNTSVRSEFVFLATRSRTNLEKQLPLMVGDQLVENVEVPLFLLKVPFHCTQTQWDLIYVGASLGFEEVRNIHTS